MTVEESLSSISHLLNKSSLFICVSLLKLINVLGNKQSCKVFHDVFSVLMTVGKAIMCFLTCNTAVCSLCSLLLSYFLTLYPLHSVSLSPSPIQPFPFLFSFKTPFTSFTKRLFILSFF